MTTADPNGSPEQKRDALLQLIALKFGEIPDDAAARVEAASAEQLALYLRRVLAASSVEAIFV